MYIIIHICKLYNPLCALGGTYIYIGTQCPRTEGINVHVYVGCKAWICATHRLRCAKCGSALCAVAHRLPTESMDCVIHSAQSTDLQAIHAHRGSA